MDKKRKTVSIVGWCCTFLGLLLLLVKAFAPERVDADGFLHEYFFLVPLGFFFLFAGIVTLLVNWWLSTRK